jgi:thiamine kinase-like enzyme
VADEMLTFVVDLTPHYPALLDWWVAEARPTLVHTDFRADNLLIGGSAGDGVVTLLDWQFCMRGPGVWDVANFLAASVTTDNRRAWEDDLVRRYHAQLTTAGVTGYDWDRCWRDYRYAIGQQAWSTLPMGELDSGNERGKLLLETLTPRYLAAAHDLGVVEMLDLF